MCIRFKMFVCKNTLAQDFLLNGKSTVTKNTYIFTHLTFLQEADTSRTSTNFL